MLCYWNEMLYWLNVILCILLVEVVCSMVVNGSGVVILFDMVYCLWLFEGWCIEMIVLCDLVLLMSVGFVWCKNIELSFVMYVVCDYFWYMFMELCVLGGVI